MSLSADTLRDARTQWEQDQADNAGTPGPSWPGRCTCGGTLRTATGNRWTCTGCTTPTPTVGALL